MSSEVIAVTGATGNIGGRVAESLLAQGKKVRALARDVDKLQSLEDHGAEIASGSLEDAGLLRRFFAGAQSAFIMIPTHYGAADVRAFQNKVSQAYADALQENGVRKIVSLSSIGAQNPEGGGPINGLYDHERRLNSIPDLNVVHLRPAFFMENHLFGLGLIHQAGIYGTPLQPDVAVPMIATQDIAAQAVNILAEQAFSGKSVRELLGPRDYTMAEATAILGASIGKPELKYVAFSYADAQKAMTGMGMSENAAALMIEMHKGFNERRIQSVEKRGPANTTRTKLEEFAKRIFAPAYMKQ